MDRAKERGGDSALGLEVHSGRGCSRTARAMFLGLARPVLLDLCCRYNINDALNYRHSLLAPNLPRHV